MISVKVYTRLEDIGRLAPYWRQLECRCPEPFTYFQSYDWCRTWLDTFTASASHERKPHIVAVWRDGRLAALWPGMVTSGLSGTRTITVLGAPHSQYSTALYDPALLDGAVVKALSQSLLEVGAGDVLCLSAIPECSLLGSIVARTDQGTQDNCTAVLDLAAYTSWEHYLTTLSGDHRRKRNQRRNKLGRCGELTFRAVHPGEADYRELLVACLTWKRQWLAETGRYSQGLSVNGHDAFLARLNGERAGPSGAVLFALEVSGRPVAIEFGFLHSHSYYAYLGSFDWELRAYSPGKVAMEMCQRWLIEKGFKSYDLLGNPAEYKATWSNRTIPLASASHSFSLKGHLIGTVWTSQVKPGLKRLYGSLPQGLRRAVLTRTLGLTFSTALMMEAA